jgi:hypothetical protein
MMDDYSQLFLDIMIAAMVLGAVKQMSGDGGGCYEVPEDLDEKACMCGGPPCQAHIPLAYRCGAKTRRDWKQDPSES